MTNKKTSPPTSASQRLLNAKAVPEPAPAAKPAKPFSKSRDIREDRGARQMKTMHNPQSMPHGH